MSDTGAPLPVDYTRVAAHIRSMEPRALTPAQHEDVITLLEYMRDQLIERDASVETRTKQVAAREAAVALRERELAIRSKAVHAAAKLVPARVTWSTSLRSLWK